SYALDSNVGDVSASLAFSRVVRRFLVDYGSTRQQTSQQSLQAFEAQSRTLDTGKPSKDGSTFQITQGSGSNVFEDYSRLCVRSANSRLSPDCPNISNVPNIRDCSTLNQTASVEGLCVNDIRNTQDVRDDFFGAKIDESINAGRGPYLFLDAHNELVQLFRIARDKCREIDVPEFKIRLYNAEGRRGYELPTSNTLGAIVFDSGLTCTTYFDVVIQHRDGPAQRVNKLHPSYMSSQFPLLFIYGQSGFHTELKLRPADGSGKAKRVTMLVYYQYQLYHRHNSYNLTFKGGRLFQQYVVGVFCCIEQNRLDFIRKKQSDISGDYLSGLYDAILRGERDGYEVGGRIILPMSFTGGPRYMYTHYLDALAICRKLGNPQFFITFTCNVNWPEIKRLCMIQDKRDLTSGIIRH
nr:DNA helicase [Tanacetum cinerariifolium]